MSIEAVPETTQSQVLQLGLIGFSPQQEADIERTLLATERSSVIWRLGPLQASAAWCIDGSRTQVLADGSIRVGAGHPGGRSVRLSLGEVDRPVAFAEPVVCKDLEPAVTFTPADAAGVVATLRDMESRWLASTLARNWLCGRLVACEASLKHRIYHVLNHGELLAVIDRTGDVGIAPHVRLPDLQTARWIGLPSSASFIPPGFHRLSWSESIWTYALQSPIDHLPKRYRSKPIFLRRPPKVAQRLLGDQHLAAMAQLRAGARTFDALQACTGLSAAMLSRTLGELYLAGSITVTRGRANGSLVSPAAWPACREAGRERGWTASGDSRPSGSLIDTEHMDRTVPAVLHFG